jgi:hypothetical protein
MIRRRLAANPAPDLSAGDPLLPETDRRLTTLARAASAGDTRSRDALLRSLDPKIDRFVGACRRRAWTVHAPRRDVRPWDSERTWPRRRSSFSATC